MSTRASRCDLAVIVAAALVVRLMFCFLVYPRVADRFGPGDGYDVIAQNLAQGNGYVIDGAPAAAERLPLYPFLLAGSFVLFGSALWPWQLAQSLCGALTCGLVFAMAQRYASRAAACAAAAVCVVHPTLVLYTARPLTETLYVVLLLLFVWAITAPVARPGAAGVALGLQLLIKSTAFVDVLGCAPLIGRAGPGGVVTAALSAVLVVLPWAGWNVWTSGSPYLLTARGGITLYHGIYISQHVGWTTPAGDFNKDAELALWRDLWRHGVARDADVRVRDQVAGAVAREWIAQHPGEAARLWARNLVLTWYLGRSRLSMLVHFALHAMLLITAAVGAARLWRARPQTRDLVMATVPLVLGYTVFHAVVQPAVRYILPVVPLVLLLAAGAHSRGRSDTPR